MGQPAAKMGDKVVGQDIHILMIPSPGGPVPTPTPMPYAGTITTGCITSVLIEGKAAAVVGSEAMNAPPHVPAGGPFQKPPDNKGKIIKGSGTVLIGGKPAARNGDPVMTCGDPVPTPNSKIIAVGKVLIGG